MRPRSHRGKPRETASPQVTFQTYTFPGPSGGWVSDQNLTVSQPTCAQRLENIFPTATGGVLRRGCSEHADITIGEIITELTGTIDTTEDSVTVAGTDTLFTTELTAGATVRIGGEDYTVDEIASDTSMTLEEAVPDTLEDATASLIEISEGGSVKSLISYGPGGANRIYATTDEGVWDVSISGSTPTLQYALTEGDVITAEYTTVDGVKYIRGVNAVDIPWVYDGSTFSDEPELEFTGGDIGLSSAIFSFTWVYKNRFFFIERASLNAWYLPVGQIGGEVTKFSLGGEFKFGGQLVFGASWSIDAGSGLSSMIVFATDQGEFAVYQGDDPSDATSWSRVGVYMVGRPRGPKSFVHRGGDIMVATDVGLVPLSGALQRDSATVALTAVSSLIEDEWREFIRLRPGDWPMAVWTANQMLILALPEAIDGDPHVWLVVNARTNRWCTFTGWNADSVIVHGDRAFFGTPDGIVYEANVGATDDGAPFVGIYVPTFDQMGVAGNKVVSMARSVTRSVGPAGEQLSAQVDFQTVLPSPPDAPAVSDDVAEWGTAVWGESQWGAGSVERVFEDYWVHLDGGGEVISIAHQVTSGGLLPSDVEFIRTDVLFTSGSVQS
jgi:hypothetical protein